MLADVWISNSYAVSFGRCAMGMDRLALSLERIGISRTHCSRMLVAGPMAGTLLSLQNVQEDMDIE